MRTRFFLAFLSGAILALAANVASAQTWQEVQTSTDEDLLIQAITNTGDAPEDIHNTNVACKRLAVYGSPKAIPALVALLPNEKLNFNARFALEAMPFDEVDAALLDATKELKGACLVGVIDTIGVRGKAESFATLKEIAAAGGGAYVRAGNDEFGLNPIVSDIQKMDAEEFSNVIFEEYDEQFMYFFAIALALFVLEMLIGDRKSDRRLFS